MKTLSRSRLNSRLFPNTQAHPLVLAIALLFAPPALMAQPTGGQVVSGQASIVSPANGLMTINQTSQKAILNWQSFSIGVGEATHFQQPVGGVALNRVTGGNASEILGSLTSTGQIFLVNPSGILFGKGAVLNVGGLVASTLDISDTNFLDGNYRFFNDGNAHSITNQGELNAYEGGYIALLAPEVRNEGVISARLGTVAIAAGNRVSLDLVGDGLINLSVEESALNGRIENKHAIYADGGQVIMSARAAGSLSETVINNKGVIRANSVAEHNGRILLEGAHFISQSGALAASGNNGLDGGAIHISSDNVLLSGGMDVSGKRGGQIDVIASGNLIQTDGSALTANAQDGRGGNISLQASNANSGGQIFLSGEFHANGNMGGNVRLMGDKVTLVDANVSATGTLLGGEILVGGGYQGAETGVPHSRQTAVNPSSILDASATDNGDGGRVIVWSDDKTAFAGQALARGGIYGGDGGLIEISGKGGVYYGGNANAGPAPGLGKSGTFLLDPKNIVISGAAQSSFGYFELSDPSPLAGDQHGTTTLVLGTNKLLVLSPYDNNAASDAGAVYVYNTATGAMLSMLTGDQANDRVGSGGITTLYNIDGNDYLIKSPSWHESAGAVTWIDGAASGINGTVSASNSLVGNANDQIGSGGIRTISNGGVYDYVVLSPDWSSGKGAVTFGSGSTGITGTVNASNSLVGSNSGDQVGSGDVTAFSNGNYVVVSPNWNGGAGAVTFMNLASHSVGAVSSANSLIGSASTDHIGSGGVEELYYNSNYNYLVFSPNWNGNFGAVTFGNGVSGVVGGVSTNNSYVGDRTGDQVGSGGMTTLYNNAGYAYLINSPLWHTSAGAVTWMDGGGSQFDSVNFNGTVSAGNSLVGINANDRVGSGGITTMLNNGVDDYVVISPNWSGGKGAATFGSGSTGIIGTVSSENSLIGGLVTDHIGSSGVTVFSSGNYAILSPNWNGGAGAVTFVGHATVGAGYPGIIGTVSNTNSLVGSASTDHVGGGGVQLLFGTPNYLVFSPDWSGKFGAVTFGSSTTGVKGFISADNSLVGSQVNDQVGSGYYSNLGNGKYILKSPEWNGGAGALTLFVGDTGSGLSGAVGSGNSFVGDLAGDKVGSGGIATLSSSDGNDYLIKSPLWHGSTGAVTWFDGSGSLFGGVVGASNSLVGSNAGDHVGSNGVTALSNGNYVVASPHWNGGAGAVTFMNPTSGTVGSVSSANSLVGSANTDGVGSGGITAINSGNDYVVLSPNWSGGLGAVTLGHGSSGVVGAIASSNSFVGDQSGDHVGSTGIVALSNDDGYNYLIKSPLWHSSAGAVTWFSGTGNSFGGVVGATNSLVGIHANDGVGSGGVYALNAALGESAPHYNYLVYSPNWNGTLGGVTFGDGATGVTGEVSSSNSLVGSHVGDRVGSGTHYSLGSGNYFLRNPNWNGGVGALTFVNISAGVTGVVAASNSIVGAQVGDLSSWTGTSLSPNGSRYLIDINSWGGNSGRLLVFTNEVGSADWGYAATPGGDITISPAQIEAIANTGTAVLLQANNDITLAADSDIEINNLSGEGGNLVFHAGRSIMLNSSITSDGDVNLYANDIAANGVQAAYRDSGVAEITMAEGTAINSDGGVLIHMLDGLSAGTVGAITLATIHAADIDFLGNVLVTHGGRLGGNGTIDGDLTVINATLAPGQSPGSMTITGDLTLGSGSVMSIEFGGTGAGEFDSISVGGVAKLGGALELLSYNGFIPPVGSDIAFLSGATSGVFSSVIDTGGIASRLVNLVGLTGSTPELDSIQSTLQPDDINRNIDLVVDVSPSSGLDKMFVSIFNQTNEAGLVGTTQQIQAAVTQLGVRREARMQAFAQAISELRTNPKIAEVAECTNSKGESSGGCLATRKLNDLDKLIADAPPDTRKRIALLIGNDAYSADIPALTTPISDVDAIANKLKIQHGFDVTVLRNASKADIIREMNRLASGSVVADSVMVMYAGHGYQEETNKGNKGMGYWIPVDAKSNTAAGWISNQDISKLLFAIPARQVMLVSDSCFSGSLTREQRVKAVKGLKREDVLKQRSVLVLSSGGEEPVTDLGHEGHSIFAWNLLKVLDTAETGLTGFELYRRVHEGVVKEFPQQPQYGASVFAGHKGDGDYFLDRLN
jgi:filamentous hemagglutinin family protein